jgi:hypothetical protein
MKEDEVPARVVFRNLREELNERLKHSSPLPGNKPDKARGNSIGLPPQLNARP